VRFAALAFVLGVASLGVASASCTKLAQPCSAGGATPLYQDASLAGRSVSLSEGPGGTTLATFILSGTPNADAGATDFAPPRSFEAIVVAPDLSTTTHVSFAAPPALTARTGGTTSVDAEYTGSGALFRWVETSIAQEPAGAMHSTLTLRVAFVSASGAPSPPRTVAACVDCALSTTSGASASFVYVFYRAQKGAAGVLRVSADGSAVDTLPLPNWLGASAPLPALSLSNGALVARTSSAFLVVDDALELASGPYVVGTGAKAFDWSPAAPLATTLGQPGDADGGVAAAGGGDLFGFSAGQDVPNLLLVRFGASARMTRVSTANTIEGMARDGDALGVSFTADGREYFALAGADGEKRGGDLDLGAAQIGSAHRIVRAAPSRWASLAVSGDALTKREVTCEE
jgi:hypothetical protein